MVCRICKSKGKKIFESTILHKYQVSYFQCPECAALYTEKPYWLDEAYSDAIAADDVGIMQRNIQSCVIVNKIIKKYIGKGTYLDTRGGGVFVRMMRNLGYDFLWSDKYAENLFARGFEYKNQDIKLITAFELMEHIEDPCSEIEKLLKYSDNIIFSTLCYDEGYDYKEPNWWYYGQEDGQYIMFYSRLTLKYIASSYNLNYYDAGVLHIFTKKKYLTLNYGCYFTAD